MQMSETSVNISSAFGDETCATRTDREGRQAPRRFSRQTHTATKHPRSSYETAMKQLRESNKCRVRERDSNVKRSAHTSRRNKNAIYCVMLAQ